MKIPSINVNIREQSCSPRCHFGLKFRTHNNGCPRSPILLPCRLPPSFAIDVVLSPGCYCERLGIGAEPRHVPNCPSRPIRVACEISGSAWEDSDISDVEPVQGQDFPDANKSDASAVAFGHARERWALLKALITGGRPALSTDPSYRLTEQRDAMYAAIADMARAEDAASEAQDRAHVALGDDLRLKPHHNIEAPDRPSTYMLERYVERVIELVGELP